jgi:phosphatidylserine/phosphatidylglycerophosphate/cardiolipin synthase-like enzyme
MAVERWRRVYYTPEDDVKSVLDRLPGTARRSIAVEIYGFTDQVFADGLIAAARRGVWVRVLNDRTQAAGPHDRAVLQRLVDTAAAEQLPIAVRVVESERGAIDHLKLVLIDDEAGALDDASSVAYGSYNFTDSAQRQDNVFVWTNDPGECARAFAKFEHDWEHNIARPEWQIQASG